MLDKQRSPIPQTPAEVGAEIDLKKLKLPPAPQRGEHEREGTERTPAPRPQEPKESR